MSALKIFNTMTRSKERFEPLMPGRVTMYVCGVTVYDECHLGHARSAVSFDMIRRYLEFLSFELTFVKNFTDVDDKIINRARQQSIPWQTVTSRYIEAYSRDMARLDVRPATIEPKATEHMQEIIAMVQALVAKGVAYQIDSDVYFAINAFPRYGALSRRKLDEMQAGARVEIDERKRHPMDFALWKGAKPGEPAWDSPWGRGRPGWHIECSAMSISHLGETFDIHGGGEDLIFPHHENEIAQSETATGKEFARYWVHNGLVTVDQEKMSKSLGNFFTIREIFEKFPASERVTAEVLRFFLLSTHYRSPLDFSDAALRQAWAGLDNFYDLFVRLKEPTVSGSAIDEEEDAQRRLQSFAQDFERGMDDDFNTPVVIAGFQSLRNDLNRRLQGGISPELRAEALEVFRHFGRVLGLFQVSPMEWEFSKAHWDLTQAIAGVFEPPDEELDSKEIERLLEDRNEARRKKNYAKADEIRLMLSARGIIIEDRSDGSTRWKR